ncbi:M23 family metallopeptidase [Microbacterium sp. IEGM 1404]|uniref:M23 family metallopeptidase n=1 Tax=Microbacterium sp. IEGM 1404 TaxID=3047084 RepID=UPI0024B87406|nr:M23 family metallopeptidase [Microbacterium sp. IEGM 1404]MDI9889980.1 M23 family metallopeptidase [Microbacterium sp. IEGM 1404]
MLLRDLTDAAAWIGRIIFRLDRLEGGAMLENASVTDGRFRFIRGLLRLDSGARLEGVGTFDWTGPGSIAGNWEVLDGGVIKVGGVLISPVGGGRIMIGAGPNGIILDGGTGSFTNGNVKIEGGKITAGTGTAQVVVDGATGIVTVGTGAAKVTIDGATGKIIAGKLTVDPQKSGGAVTFENGAEVFTDADTIQVFKGNSVVQISDDYAKIQHGGDVIEIDGEGIRMSPGAVPTSESIEGAHWLALDVTTGRLRRINPAFGGPGGGQFEYPFPETTITSGFRPPERPTHNGIDQAGPGVDGEMIPAAAAGVVTFAGGVAEDTPTNGYGYHVIINHGTINGRVVETLYAHMATPPVISAGDTVQKRQPLGPVGETGRSQGVHLHWEIHVDGNPVDPVIFMADYS